MIVDRIEAYLRATGRTLDEALLAEMGAAFVKRLRRQFMEGERAREPGGMYLTLLSHPCARKGVIKSLVLPTDPPEPRTRINWWIGDVVEIGILSLAQLAGCDVGHRQARVDLDLGGGIQVKGYLDEVLYVKDETHPAGALLPVEVKSMNGYGFDRFCEDGPDDTWGYVSQLALQIRGSGAPGGLLVACNKETGHLREAYLQAQDPLVEAAFSRGRLIAASTAVALADRAAALDAWYGSGGPDLLPKVPFEPVAETVYNRKTKHKDPTGRIQLGLVCSYCEAKRYCHPTATMEVTDRGKPVWILPSREPVTA